MPGGRLNEVEEWDDALLRELKEEVDLDCNNPKPFAVNILKDDYQIKYCTYFTLDIFGISKISISKEHSNFNWFSTNEIENLNIEDEKIKK